MSEKYDIAVMGVAVMGQNLILNMSDHGFSVAVHNRTASKVDEFLASDAAQGRKLLACHSLKETVASLKRPRKVMLMIKSPDAIPALEDKLYPEVSAGNHNGVTFRNNLLYILKRDLSFDFGDNRRVLVPALYKLPGTLDIIGGLHKRKRHVINILRQAETEGLQVLLGGSPGS